MTKKTGTDLMPQLTQASDLLVQATSDFERMRVRDAAAGVKAAASILRRRDIEVSASILIADAEREIARAHPAAQGQRTDLLKEPEPVDLDEEDIGWLIQLARQAHADIPDERYEELKAEATRLQRPLSRQFLLAESRAIRRAAQAAEQSEQTNQTEQAQEPDPEELARHREEGYLRRIAELEGRLESAEERAAIALNPDVEQRFNTYRTEIETLRSQLANCQRENDRKDSVIAVQREKLKAAGIK